MEAVLYICHGSRVPKASEEARFFIEKCMSRLSEKVFYQECCFLELAEPSIEDAFTRCVEKGATKISALPILLLTAGHAKSDIPEELIKMKKKYPHITIQYGRPIGVHPQMIDIVEERIKDSQVQISENSSILLVGRGASDPEVQRDFSELANLLSKKTNLSVDICYLAACEPSFEEGLRLAGQREENQIFVVPYLLFTGILMKTMEKKIKTINKEMNKEFILCNYLGYHQILQDVIVSRVHEVIDNTVFSKEILDVPHHA
ncbi:sirohydrochlorin chelatase [Litchfieldia salsa]|uniref:Sirohydrochlorin ferrochelatase n=1 Tax=Litchfieldia salsa TaxID=930152 RepID=A0A1H0SV52_9BACI|nr:sirohydrochlorin chelatase [Litchfieldia salsa]SDP45148.1 sirohydrochlorin ferrochelatase [Litchfieldia salsa]